MGSGSISEGDGGQLQGFRRKEASHSGEEMKRKAALQMLHFNLFGLNTAPPSLKRPGVFHSEFHSEVSKRKVADKIKFKGLAAKCKATEGHVRFGCNLGQMIAYICGL